MHAGFIGTGLGTVPIRIQPRLPSLQSLRSPHSPRPARRSIVAMSQKMLHAVYRVGDLDATRKFLEALGMHVTRERDIPAEKYSNVFFGYGPEQNGFGHFGIGVEDASKVVERVRAAGFKVTREVGPVKGGTTVIAFVEDPTGYKFEIIEEKRRDPLYQVMLRVKDLDKSIAFYEAMGMKLFRRSDNEEYKYTLAFMGFGTEEDNALLELTYNWGENEYTPGNGYAQIAISSPDVYAAAKRFEEKGIAVVRPPGPVAGIGTKITAIRDPDGWKTVLVDAQDFENEF